MTKRNISLRVNGIKVDADIPNRLLLVDFLRENLALTGTHVGCTYEGACGACTVQINGEAVKSCMMLAVQAAGADVVTIEGIGTPAKPHVLQETFREFGALQCGFCTPGIIMNMDDLLRSNSTPSEDEIRHALKGNICRCTGYTHIVEAVSAASERMRFGAQGAVA